MCQTVFVSVRLPFCQLGLGEASDDGKSVSERQDDFIKSWVSSHLVVELTECDGLLVAIVGRVNDMPVPEGVVGDKPTSDRQQLSVQQQVEIGAVFTLVGVHKYKVVGGALVGEKLLRVLDDKVDFVVKGRKGEISPDSIFELIVVFNGSEQSVWGQSFGKAEGGIAGESAKFKDALRLYHKTEHGEQPSLDMSGDHTGVEHITISVARDETENLVFGGRMGFNVVEKFHGVVLHFAM